MNKKKILIPLLGFFFLLLLSLIGLFVYEYIRIKPNDVRFTNITSSSVTVSWNTDSSMGGSVIVFEGESNLPIYLSLLGEKEKFYDTRDVRVAELQAVSETSNNISGFGLSMEDLQTEVIVNEMGEYYTHHVTITGLDENSRYTIMLGEKLLFRKFQDNFGRETIMTRKILDNLPSPYPVYGSVKDANLDDKTPINELDVVSDAVVYFNYWDEITNQKSDNFSTPVNEVGNWYMDVSQAIDFNMDYFLEKYDTVEENVFAEIIVDAGPLGMWMMREYPSGTSPTSTMVLNMVDSIEDLEVPGSLIKLEKNENDDNYILDDVLDNSLGLVKSVYADPGACFSSGGSWSGSSCYCPTNYSLVNGRCQAKSSCKKISSSCACVCVPESSTYDTVVTCPQKDNCGNSCGNPSRKTCRKPPSVCSTTNCSPCTPQSCSGSYPLSSCPSGESCERKNYTCNDTNECGSSCPKIRTRTCYKVVSTTVTDPDPDPDPKPKTDCSNPAFRQYCGPCVGTLPNGSYGDECPCPEKKLTERSCTKGDDEKISERLECAGGYSVNKVLPYAGSCRICTLVPKGGGEHTYYQALWRDASSTHNYTNGKCVKIQSAIDHQCSTIGEIEKLPGGYWCRECVMKDGRRVWDFVKCKVIVPGEVESPELNGDETLIRYAIEGGVCKRKEIGGEGLQDYHGILYRTIHACMDALERASLPKNACGEKSAGYSCLGYNLAGQTYTTYRGVCNAEGDCVVIGEKCNTRNGVGEWGYNGKCNPYGAEDMCAKKALQNLYRGEGENREKCEKGVWVSDPDTRKNPMQCVEGVKCSDFIKRSFCVDKGGNTLVCFHNKWIKPEEQEYLSKRAPVYKVTPIAAGSECLEGVCRCNSGIDIGRDIDIGEFCREVDSLKCEKDGEICNRRGWICLYSEEHNDSYCVSSSSPLNSYDKNKENKLLSSFENKVLAETNGLGTEYVIDFKTGMFIGLEEGVYTFEYEGEIYSFSIDIFNDIGGEGVLLYIDTNENGQYEEGIDIKVSDIASKINIISTSKVYNYRLTKGINFVSFPFLIENEDSRTAAGLLTELNDIYDDSISSIAKYDGRWKIVGEHVEVYDTNDFQILPGQGYLISSRSELSVRIAGHPVKFETDGDNAKIAFNPGWNLIGLYGTNIKSYTAKSLITDINQTNLNADNVTRWERDRQMYDGLQISEGQEYGFDFPINLLESYFVRITEGRGNWQPKLGGNN